MKISMNSTATTLPTDASTWTPMSAHGEHLRRGLRLVVELDAADDYAIAHCIVRTVDSFDAPCCELERVEVDHARDKASARAWVEAHVEQLVERAELSL